jgi:hypothetical protein
MYNEEARVNKLNAFKILFDSSLNFHLEFRGYGTADERAEEIFQDFIDKELNPIDYTGSLFKLKYNLGAIDFFSYQNCYVNLCNGYFEAHHPKNKNYPLHVLEIKGEDTLLLVKKNTTENFILRLIYAHKLNSHAYGQIQIPLLEEYVFYSLNTDKLFVFPYGWHYLHKIKKIM